MGITMQQNTRVVVKTEAHCQICGAIAEIDGDSRTQYTCDWDCPTKVCAARDALLMKQPRYNCPKCTKGTVSRNKDDFLECDSCRIQFSRSPHGDDTWERTILIDQRDNIVHVEVYPLKGKGDLWVKEYKRDTQKAKKTMDRMIRLLSFLRRGFQCQEIFFNGREFIGPDSLDRLALEILQKDKYLRFM